MDYSRWDKVYDSDEERQREKDAAKRQEAAERKQRLSEQRMAAKAKKQADSMPKKADGSEMTEKDFMEQYEKMFSPGGPPKQPYKFPDTLPEQRAICDAAAALKERGNAFYAQGEYTEAAKMYEQGVLKFADWYAESFATDEERTMVHAIKLPCHLNLAECSRRLGNHQHAVVHCTQVLDHMDDANVKALFRRGASQLRLGNLDEAHADLKRALALSPRDPQLRAEFAELKERQREYKARVRALASRGLAGAGAEGDGEPPAASSPAPGAESIEAGTAVGAEADAGVVREHQAAAAAAAAVAEATTSVTAATPDAIRAAFGCNADGTEDGGHASAVAATEAAITEQAAPAKKPPSAERMASVAMRSTLPPETLNEPRIIEALRQLEEEADRKEGARQAGAGETGIVGKAWQTLRDWLVPLPPRQLQGMGACTALAVSVGAGAVMRRMWS